MAAQASSRQAWNANALLQSLNAKQEGEIYTLPQTKTTENRKT